MRRDPLRVFEKSITTLLVNTLRRYALDPAPLLRVCPQDGVAFVPGKKKHTYTKKDAALESETATCRQTFRGFLARSLAHSLVAKWPIAARSSTVGQEKLLNCSLRTVPAVGPE